MFLHHALHWNQMYNFSFSHDNKLWTILVIKHVWNHFVKMFQYKQLNFFCMIGHMAHLLWSILQLIQNLKAFGEGLNNKKHVHILWLFLALVKSPLHMQKDLHNTMKWFQIHRMITSWLNKHSVEKLYLYHLNVICDTFSK
jgi:hypothetical protein